MRKIQLRGRQNNLPQALVDDEDYDNLARYGWYLNGGYAIRVTSRADGSRVIKMHREVMGVLDDSKKIIDHIDRDRLNNQRNNLRIVTPRENSMNSVPRYKNNTSGYKGVSWHKNRGKWQAYIIINQKFHYLGIFKEKNDAIKARLKASRQMVEAKPPIQNQE